MTQTTTGWVTFIIALCMMVGLMSADVAQLSSMDAVWTPAFISAVMAHFATVGLSFAAGKMIPTERTSGLKTRSTDRNVSDVTQKTIGE